MANYINFKFGPKENFKAIETKETNTLYFCTDTKEIFKGENSYTESVRFGNYTAADTFPTNPAQGILYINTVTGNSKVYNGTDWQDVILKVSSLTDANDTDIPNVKAVRDAIEGIKTDQSFIDVINNKIDTKVTILDLPNTYDAKGSAAAVLGEDTDTVDSKTVEGAFKNISAIKKEISNLKVGDVGASYEIEAVEDSTYAATYKLKKTLGEVTEYVGAAINVPKDMVVQSGSVKVVETADTPVAGYVVGDKYVDLVIANATDEHIYILVSDLVSSVTKGNNAVDVTNNAVSVKVKETNGLSIGSDGIEIAPADADNAGVMSAEHYTKIENLANVKSFGNGIKLNVATGEASLNLAENSGLIVDAETGAVKIENVTPKSISYNDLTDKPEAATTLADGFMSAADKAKLDGVENNAQVNVLEEVQINGTTLTATDKAVNITVATGTSNGTIAVNGTDVTVANLGSAAFENTTAFDAKGSAAAVLGTAEDTAETNTIMGLKAKIAEVAENAKIEWGTF